MPDQPARTSWRKWLRFSVRGLIILVLVVGVWLGSVVRSARAQREAVAAIKRAGGLAWYEWEWSNGRLVRGAKPPAPPWLVRCVGIDYFGDVVAAWMSPRDGLRNLLQGFEAGGIYQRDGLILSEATLAMLGSLKRLEYLDLHRTLTDDSGLEQLRDLRHLKHLSLDDTNVTDAGLTHLRGMADLKVLSLYGTDTTDAGMKELQWVLPKLKIRR